jgi:hypothetical protein
MDENRLNTLAALGGDIAALVAEVKAARGASSTPTPPSQSPLRVGNSVLVRTVTHYYTGKIADIGEHEILLDDAAWVASTWRFFDALRSGKLDEVEPIVGPVIIGRGALIDCVDWRHALPKEQK